jgi:hypothetical protein
MLADLSELDARRSKTRTFVHDEQNGFLEDAPILGLSIQN